MQSRLNSKRKSSRYRDDNYPCRDALGPDGAFRSAGACPPLEPSMKLGATRVLLIMSGRSVLGNWAPGKMLASSPSSSYAKDTTE